MVRFAWNKPVRVAVVSALLLTQAAAGYAQSGAQASAADSARTAAVSRVVQDTTLPKVLVMATGGTIAGVQSAPGTLGGYRAGTLTAEQIIESVPTLADFAQVEAEQFSNVASPNITTEQWVALAKRINSVLAERNDIAGVIVTHGTDRLEETAFFLYLTIRSEKPVIVVGSQRPATGISPDGPINLLAAVRTAASPQAVGKGVMVVMDDRILSAREVRKQYQRVGGFGVGEMGMLGVMSGGGPEFFFSPARRHGSVSEFDLTGVDTLPRVELMFSYPGGTGPRFDSLPDGVVVATTGFAPGERTPYRDLRQQGVVLVTAFPSGDNVNSPPRPRRAPAAADSAEAASREADSATTTSAAADSAATDSAPADSAPADSAPADSAPADSAAAQAAAERATPPSVVSQHLTPQKARILLMLALTKTRDPREVQRYFVEY